MLLVFIFWVLVAFHVPVQPFVAIIAILSLIWILMIYLCERYFVVAVAFIDVSARPYV